jgi:hypothetical protein
MYSSAQTMRYCPDSLDHMSQMFSLRPISSTSSSGTPADTSPAELDLLAGHFARCQEGPNWLATLWCTIEAANQIFARRLFTVVAMLALGGILMVMVAGLVV